MCLDRMCLVCLDLCISILEFKVELENKIYEIESHLCISILEFKGKRRGMVKIRCFLFMYFYIRI